MISLLLAATLASAPALAADTPPLRVTPVGVERLELGRGGARFDLVVEAERLKGLPVQIRTLDYTLDVDRVKIAQTRGDYRGQRLRLKRGQPVRFSIPVELDAAEAMAIIASGLGQGLDLRVRLTGHAKVRLLFIPFRIPVRTDLVRLER